jgi:microcystin-dependent protein
VTNVPTAPGSHDPTTGWTQDAASGFQRPAGVGTHNHPPADIQSLTTYITSVVSAYSVPVGVINAYYGTSAPANWLLCDGSAIPAQYTALIALVGANTPNLKGKVIVSVDGAQTEFNTLGLTGGAKTVALALGELASHSHSHNHGSHGHSHDHPWAHSAQIGTHQHTVTTSLGGANIGLTAGANNFALQETAHTTTTEDNAHSHTGIVVTNDQLTTPTTDATTAGSGTAHQNLQPYMAINYIIKAA